MEVDFVFYDVFAGPGQFDEVVPGDDYVKAIVWTLRDGNGVLVNESRDGGIV